MTQHDVHLAIDQSQGFSIACRNSNEKQDNSKTSKSCSLSGVWVGLVKQHLSQEEALALDALYASPCLGKGAG